MLRKTLCARSFLSVVALGSALVGLGGCSSSSDSESPDAPGESGESQLEYCTKQDTAPDFTQGWMVPGQSMFDIAIDNADPASPKLGKNTWVVAVKDKDGAAVTDADVSIKCSMVGHNHGCAVDPTITNNGDGTYTIAPLVFNMQKHWDIRVTVSTGTGSDEKIDYSIFPICVP
jgi:hypothetical protein